MNFSILFVAMCTTIIIFQIYLLHIDHTLKDKSFKVNIKNKRKLN
ncbi:Uncharacterised protein [Yersinia enterocolitica]|nr:hypothetical protein CH47_515 [Yersinia enterocolitica]VTP81213.1 Uncharacterised protein [Yersinia enterocolitica subsp. enterocolitica]AJJ24591.1 hypothetical protein CH49_523 [Yersinia enterocolitica]KGA71901.1 hypothetical protein DJ59_1462 [Yersinia enterocolitica]KGA75849.1 hypothetical protein DJ60_1542 [Yersinia enterocolitica]